MVIGIRIARLRQERGLTQKQLAKEVGISERYLRRIEGGKRPGIKTVVMIAEAFGVEARVFYEEEEK